MSKSSSESSKETPKAFISAKSELSDCPFISSSNGRYSAVIHQDGNFVVYDDSEVKKLALWSSGTGGKGSGPYSVELRDGNLGVYDSSATKLWSTNTENKGQEPYGLDINDNGNLRICDGKNEIIWCSTPLSDRWSAGDKMFNGNGMAIESLSQKYDAGMQGGHLVLQELVYGVGKLLWKSDNTTSAYYLLLGLDGKLGLFDSFDNDVRKWGGSGGDTPYFLHINDDQNSILRVIRKGDTQNIAYQLYPPLP